jgi:YbbR domain-containing protein
MNGWSWPTRVQPMQPLPPRPPGAPLVRQNFLLFFACFIFAVILWMYVAGADPDPGPAINREVTVPVRFVGASLLVLSSDANQVTVTIQGPSVPDHPTVRAVVDVSKITDPGRYRRPIHVTALIPSTANITWQPDFATVTLDKPGTRSLPVQYSGSSVPAPGYSVAGHIIVNPTRVSVTGPATLLAQVHPTVSYDLTDLTSSVDIVRPVSLPDIPDGEIHWFQIQPSHVRLYVPIQRQLVYAAVPIHVQLVGEPAPGYTYRAEVIPSTVTIAGSPTAVDNTASLSTMAVSLNRADRDISRRIGLEAPPGVRVNGPATVQLRILISPTAVTSPPTRAGETPASRTSSHSGGSGANQGTLGTAPANHTRGSVNPG